MEPGIHTGQRLDVLHQCVDVALHAATLALPHQVLQAVNDPPGTNRLLPDPAQHALDLVARRITRVQQPATRLGEGGDGRQRLVYFVGDARGHLPHDPDTGQMRHPLAQLPLALAQEHASLQSLRDASQAKCQRDEELPLGPRERPLVAHRRRGEVAHLDVSHTLTADVDVHPLAPGGLREVGCGIFAPPHHDPRARHVGVFPGTREERDRLGTDAIEGSAGPLHDVGQLVEAVQLLRPLAERVCQLLQHLLRLHLFGDIAHRPDVAQQFTAGRDVRAGARPRLRSGARRGVEAKLCGENPPLLHSVVPTGGYPTSVVGVDGVEPAVPQRRVRSAAGKMSPALGDVHPLPLGIRPEEESRYDLCQVIEDLWVATVSIAARHPAPSIAAKGPPPRSLLTVARGSLKIVISRAHSQWRDADT